MDKSTLSPVQSGALYQLRVLQEVRAVHAEWRQTGVLQSRDKAPHFDLLWMFATAAVRYASQAIGDRQGLPKRFSFVGAEWGLLFPAEGYVEVLWLATHENLCVGFEGWTDPMTVKPASKT